MRNPHHARRDGAPSQRQLRVAELIRQRLADIFVRGAFDEALLARATLTVTEVRITPDLRRATAYIMPLGGAHIGQIMPLLAQHAPALQMAVGKGLALKYTPKLIFQPDESFDAAQQMDALLASDKVRRDLGK